MSLHDDYEYLRQLANEIPVQQAMQFGDQLSYVGDEASLVFGHGHPGADRVAEHVRLIKETCELLTQQVTAFAEYLRNPRS